jgi:hypothetical protein
VGGPPDWGLGGGLTTLPRKTQYLLRITTHSPKEKDHLEDQGVGGIRMDLREIGLGGGCVHWIRLDQDRDRWRAVVSAVMNLRVLALRS